MHKNGLSKTADVNYITKAGGPQGRCHGQAWVLTGNAASLLSQPASGEYAGQLWRPRAMLTDSRPLPLSRRWWPTCSSLMMSVTTGWGWSWGWTSSATVPTWVSTPPPPTPPCSSVSPSPAQGVWGGWTQLEFQNELFEMILSSLKRFLSFKNISYLRFILCSGQGEWPGLFCPQVYINMGLPRWLSGKEIRLHAGSIPGWGRSPGGNGNPLQSSCLENPMNRGAWWATVLKKNWTWLSNSTNVSDLLAMYTASVWHIHLIGLPLNLP